MFRHELAAIVEKIEIRHRGASVCVTVSLAHDGPRPPFRVDIDADPEITWRESPIDGGVTLEHGDDSIGAWIGVRYWDSLPRSFPTFFLEGPREWSVSWEEVTPHPVIVAARARADAARESVVEGNR